MKTLFNKQESLKISYLPIPRNPVKSVEFFRLYFLFNINRL